MSTTDDEFRPYPGNRKVKRHPAGFSIIVPTDRELVISLCCPVCTYALRSRDDEEAYREFECCDRCSRLWAASRREVWKAGWRPTAEQIHEAEKDRPPLMITLDVD